MGQSVNCNIIKKMSKFILSKRRINFSLPITIVIIFFFKFEHGLHVTTGCCFDL